MVYVDPKNLGYNLYWERWVNSLPAEDDRKELRKLFDKYVPQGIGFILEGIKDGKIGEKLKPILPVTNLNMVCQQHSSTPDHSLLPSLCPVIIDE